MPRNERGERLNNDRRGIYGAESNGTLTGHTYKRRKLQCTSERNWFSASEGVEKAHTERIPLKNFFFFFLPDDDYVFCFQTTCYANYFLRTACFYNVYTGRKIPFYR